MNQLVNPCFDGPHNVDPLTWQQTPGWDVSVKPSNPPCGAPIIGRSTSSWPCVRLNVPELQGEASPNTDETIWQEVSGLGPQLIAEWHMVCHKRGEAGEYRVYGRNTPEDPWLLLWTPFTLASYAGDGKAWSALMHAETVLADTYAIYKVELFGNIGPGVYPGSGGLKYAAVYFESRA